MKMDKYITPVFIAISAGYALAAVFAYLFHYAAHTTSLQQTLLPATTVVLPYILLLLPYRLAREKWSLWATNASAIAVSILGALAYAESFQQRYEADMYVLTYFAVPALQTLIVIATFVYIMLRRRHLCKPYGA
ncbi:MAG: hypothetical protein ABFS22_01970 [Pseudomonadota bacterium]